MASQTNDANDSELYNEVNTPRKRLRLSSNSINRVPGAKMSHPPLKSIAETQTLVSADKERDIQDFDSIGVHGWLAKSLSSLAIRRPTVIQKHCIPAILRGRDCIGGSRTGSGKTVAFAVPILQKWAVDPVGIYALVLTPTRELALQIYEQINAIAAPQSLKAILITGGSDMRQQAINLSLRPHIVIATPGRLADHIETSGEETICGLRRARFVVLDEADRLLASASKHGSMLPDVDTCLSVLPPPSKRQTCLFTATVTPEVRALKEMPRTPEKPPIYICEVDTETIAVPETLHQTYITVPEQHREVYLHTLLSTPANTSKPTIIFCNRASTAAHLERTLRLLDHRTTALHSALSQRERTDNLARFRARAARILVATDVAARGLDVPTVALVINFDVPHDPDDYVHRVGRTARAGRRGESVTMVMMTDLELLGAIEIRVGGRKMEAYEEEGVSLEGRVVRDGLKIVGEKKREALVQIEQGLTVAGKRKRQKLKPVGKS